MPGTDAGLPALALITIVAWAAAGALAVPLPAVAAVLATTPAVVGAYRDRRLGHSLALGGAAFIGAAFLAAGTPLPTVALGAAAVGALGLLAASVIGTAAAQASAYRVWYHGLRDHLPAATLFFMPVTGRVHDLDDRAAALLGPLGGRSFAEAFEDPAAYATFAADVAAGEVVARGAWMRDAAGGKRWCELTGAMATPVLAAVLVEDRTVERSAADALTASEAAHRSLVTGAPGAAVLVDEELRVVAAGGGALALLAGSEEPVVGRTVWTAFPDRVAQALEPLARLAAFGTPGTCEVDASGRRFLLAAEPVLGDGGTVAGAVMTASDVTPLAEYLAGCEERRGLAETLLAVHREEGTGAAERLLAAAVRATGSRYGAVLGKDGDRFTPLAVSPALAGVNPVLLATGGETASRGAVPETTRPLDRILAVPAGERGVIVVADRSSPYTEREEALVRALAEEGFAAADRARAGVATAARARSFESLLATVPVPLILVGRDGQVRLENDAARALFGGVAPDQAALRFDPVDRSRFAATEERRRHGARGVPARYRASVLDANGASRPCLVASASCPEEEAVLLAFLDLGPAAAFDTCRDRAMAGLEARLESALGSPVDDAGVFVEEVRRAWRASVRERAVLAAPTPYEALPPECRDYS